MPADPDFDAVASRMYRDDFSTYEVAGVLAVSQAKVARSLRRTNTRRRTNREAQMLFLSTARKVVNHAADPR